MAWSFPRGTCGEELASDETPSCEWVVVTMDYLLRLVVFVSKPGVALNKYDCKMLGTGYHKTPFATLARCKCHLPVLDHHGISFATWSHPRFSRICHLASFPEVVAFRHLGYRLLIRKKTMSCTLRTSLPKLGALARSLAAIRSTKR